MDENGHVWWWLIQFAGDEKECACLDVLSVRFFVVLIENFASKVVRTIKKMNLILKINVFL
jgi:hypothetical protein